MKKVYIQGVKQLEEKIKKLDLTYKRHKDIYNFSRAVVTGLILVCLYFTIKEVNFLYVIIAFLLLGVMNAQAVLLKQERALIGNLQEWCVYSHSNDRKDIAIHNLTEIFFTIKEELQDSKIRRGKIYDKVIEMSKLINDGSVVRSDCLNEIKGT